jgi:DNA modification methylase
MTAYSTRSPAVRSPRVRTNGYANKLDREDAPVHRWYRFVLSFPPHLVRSYVDKFALKPGHTILDPFCGTGTTVVESKKLGIHGIGMERNPIAFFATRVKTDWAVDPDELFDHATRIAQRAFASLERQGLGFELNLLRDAPDDSYPPHLRTLPAELDKLLLKDSISPVPLHKTLTLLDEIEASAPSRFTDHQRLALALALISGISNIQFGPEVGVGPPKSDAPVVSLWLDHVRAIADDLREVRRLSAGPSEVCFGDARDVGNALPSKSVDAVITSPPYPNEKDYTRTTRLESVLLGFLNSRAELQSLKRGLVRSNTRGVYRHDDDDEWVVDNTAVQEIAQAIETRRLRLGKTSGFERMYPRVTKLYFGGMAKHLSELRRVLRPGARLAYVVGDQASYLRVMIRTGQLLGEIAEKFGYQVINRDLFRTRLATATREQLREEVLLLRWDG